MKSGADVTCAEGSESTRQGLRPIASFQESHEQRGAHYRTVSGIACKLPTRRLSPRPVGRVAGQAHFLQAWLRHGVPPTGRFPHPANRDDRLLAGHAERTRLTFRLRIL